MPDPRELVWVDKKPPVDRSLFPFACRFSRNWKIMMFLMPSGRPGRMGPSGGPDWRPEDAGAPPSSRGPGASPRTPGLPSL